MRFFRFLKKELFYAGLSKTDYQLVREAVSERNRKSLIAWPCAWGLFWLVSLFLYSAPEYSKPWVVFLVSLIISLVTTLCGLFLIKRKKWLLYPMMYLYILSVFGTGIGLAVTQPDKRIATVIAVATITPTFFIVRTISTILTEAIAVSIYAVLGKIFIIPEVFSWGMETLILFSLAGILSGHIINKSRFERFVYSETAEKMAEEAKRANEAKSRFLASISHEIRTPINAVLGMDEMILRESEDNSIITYAEIIKTSGNTLLGLINDLLDFSKIEADRMEIIPVDYDLSSVINDLVNMIAVRADDKGLELKLDIDRNIPKFLNGDEIRIKQVITNILVNAVKYTEKGGVTFCIGYEKDENESDYVILKVSVKDTGIGIREEDMTKLFSKFERIDEERNRNVEGTGLGMSITKRLLEMMGSSLKVYSVYGKGSDFSFEIKQKVIRWEAVGDYEASYRDYLTEHEKYKEAFTAPDARILVVDDNLMNLLVFKSLIKHTQIKVDCAEDGDQGIRLSQDGLYDIIFLDHLMPGKDGIEVLREIKSESANPNLNTPYICLTANAVSGAREQYLAEGFDDYLSKPIDSACLEEMLIRLLPDEKVIRNGSDNSPNSMHETDDFEDPVPLKEQSIIDVERGIENTGSSEEYLSILRGFSEILDERAQELQRLYDDEDILNYTIKVHAMKSSLRIIGAMEPGEAAQRLEDAGKADDIGYISDHHPEFMDELRMVKALLQDMFSEDRGKALPPAEKRPLADEELITMALDEIDAAAKDKDRSRLDAVFSELEDFCIPEDKSVLFSQIKSAAAADDYYRINEILNTSNGS